jgi:hypothetical protein
LYPAAVYTGKSKERPERKKATVEKNSMKLEYSNKENDKER